MKSVYISTTRQKGRRMSTELRIEFTCTAAEWELEEFLSRVQDNVAAKRYWHQNWLSREREDHTIIATFEVHKLLPFLLAALGQEAFRAALFDGLERDYIQDLNIEIEEIEVR